jgi:hypothetical protein
MQQGHHGGPCMNEPWRTWHDHDRPLVAAIASSCDEQTSLVHIPQPGGNADK